MIIGTGMTALGKSGLTASRLVQQALERALASAGVRLRQLDGIVAVPSLSEPRFMEAHYLATMMGLLPHRGLVARTIDTGGAGPISGLLEADWMVRTQGLDLVAVVAGDAVSSLPTHEFLRRADAGCADADGSLPSPVIPSGYNRVAQWAIDSGAVTREQLAMSAVLMSMQAVKHPFALTRKAHSLKDVLNSKKVGSATNILECARRADGGAAIIVASSNFVQREGLKPGPKIIGGGEASGPLYPPRVIDEELFSCEEAVRRAYDAASCGVQDVKFFGLYDCFPICFIRALEAVGKAKRGQGGKFVEDMYHRALANGGTLDPNEFPINTHGGLLSFGAPWETPAMYNTIECVAQLQSTAGDRQVSDCNVGLVYGNGGIFSASAVAILERP